MEKPLLWVRLRNRRWASPDRKKRFWLAGSTNCTSHFIENVVRRVLNRERTSYSISPLRQYFSWLLGLITPLVTLFGNNMFSREKGWAKCSTRGARARARQRRDGVASAGTREDRGGGPRTPGFARSRRNFSSNYGRRRGCIPACWSGIRRKYMDVITRRRSGNMAL